MARLFATLGLPHALGPLLAVAPSFGALLAATALIQIGPLKPVLAPGNMVKPKPSITEPALASPPAGYTIRRALTLSGPFRHGDWVWNERAAPAAGPMLITVDLQAQTLSVYRAGYEIGTAVILYGDGDKPTPLGRFSVTEKDADHRSNLYDAPMPYMLRLTNDGISIHGSEDVQPIYATNGCVGVPVAFAKKLFNAVAVGTSVVITDGQTLQIGDTLRQI